MKKRCTNPNCKDYKDYGGRGIKVFPEWNTFEQFMGFAKSSGYEDGLTIERIDVNKGYEPSNCCWVTMPEQAANKRSNRKISDGDEVLTVAEVSRRHGISAWLIYQWCSRYGFTTWEEINNYHQNKYLAAKTKSE